MGYKRTETKRRIAEEGFLLQERGVKIHKYSIDRNFPVKFTVLRNFLRHSYGTSRRDRDLSISTLNDKNGDE